MVRPRHSSNDSPPSAMRSMLGKKSVTTISENNYQTTHLWSPGVFMLELGPKFNCHQKKDTNMCFFVEYTFETILACCSSDTNMAKPLLEPWMRRWKYKNPPQATAAVPLKTCLPPQNNSGGAAKNMSPPQNNSGSAAKDIRKQPPVLAAAPLMWTLTKYTIYLDSGM